MVVDRPLSMVLPVVGGLELGLQTIMIRSSGHGYQQ